jgi:hypothetical protein
MTTGIPVAFFTSQANQKKTDELIIQCDKIKCYYSNISPLRLISQFRHTPYAQFCCLQGILNIKKVIIYQQIDI